ncbi:hypothetical protein C5C71_17060 [Rathayibacter sp. AY1C1]|nr:hypothetical protein C5C71_17060 [Rathayibacter sp. AY1C1]
MPSAGASVDGAPVDGAPVEVECSGVALEVGVLDGVAANAAVEPSATSPRAPTAMPMVRARFFGRRGPKLEPFSAGVVDSVMGVSSFRPGADPVRDRLRPVPSQIRRRI